MDSSSSSSPSIQDENLPRLIVAAVDGSEPSLRAASLGITIAKRIGSKVIVLHVLLLPFYAAGESKSSLERELTTRAATIFERVDALSKTSDFQVQHSMVSTDGSVVKAIVEFARDAGADLIVIGTKGVSGFERLMLGSVAAGVVSTAHCAVLVVR